jgi:UDP-glucuronate decarboxylase
MNKGVRKILVTGGAGFLGSHLCDRLVEAGHDVLCVDNLFTGSRSNIAHLMGRPNFEFMRHDVTMPLYVEVDEIYNLACPASPLQYRINPVQTTKTSVHGAINMLGLAKRTGAKILQASTSEVYGDPEVHPQPESYRGAVNPIGPRACYDEGKRVAETLFSVYRAQHGVGTRIARIFNTYGPNMERDDGRVVSNFIMQALRGEPLTVYGSGRQTRSFCFVSDLVEGLVRLMEADDVEGPVNLGNPGERTVGALASLVLRMTGSRSRVVRRPLPVDDPRRRRPDISKARRLLGWEPKVPLEEGLPQAIRWFREAYI